jgi:protein-ribulosamine 3-kinase
MAGATQESLKVLMQEDKSIVTDYVHPHSLGGGAPTTDIPLPQVRGEFKVDTAVLSAFPIAGTKLIAAHHYGSSLWGITAKLLTKLPDGSSKPYFHKVQ